MPRFLSTEALDDRCFRPGNRFRTARSIGFVGSHRPAGRSRRSTASKCSAWPTGTAFHDTRDRRRCRYPATSRPRAIRRIGLCGMPHVWGDLGALWNFRSSLKAFKPVAKWRWCCRLGWISGLGTHSGACNDVQPASRGRLSSVVEVPAQVARYLGTIFTEYAPLRCQSSSIRMPRIEFATIDA